MKLLTGTLVRMVEVSPIALHGGDAHGQDAASVVSRIHTGDVDHGANEESGSDQEHGKNYKNQSWSHRDFLLPAFRERVAAIRSPFGSRLYHDQRPQAAPALCRGHESVAAFVFDLDLWG